MMIYEMIAETIAFIFIVICYLLLVASIFTTLYQDVNPNKFGGMALSLWTLFNAGSITLYTYTGMGDQEA